MPPDSQLAGGEPLIFRGLEVGRLETPQLVGDTTAVLVDAFIIRLLLVPSAMLLLGEANWWAPRPLRAVFDRLRIRES